MPDYGDVTCAVCGHTAKKNAPRQATCGRPACRVANSDRVKREHARKRAAAPAKRNAPPLAPLPAELADVLNEPHRLGLREFMFRVKLLHDAVRTKDRRAYEHTLLRIIGWGMSELARVRSTGDASGS